MIMGISPNLRRTIAGSSAGTLIEWYDFFLYGALASFFAKIFFAGLPPATGYFFSLLTFAAGFLVRPLGAVVFGVIGDRWGRKNTFLVTMVFMGLSTVAVGLIPDYATIGVWAPVLLVTARLVQGLAVGGEYGGAATFIAEHAPADRRGFATSFIQLTCTLGLALALAAVVLARVLCSPEQFASWGWRVPFVASAVLLVIAYWIRRRLDESPLFKERREAKSLSQSPLADTFRGKRRIASFLLATLALSGGMTVIFYTSQFYVLTFMTKSALLDDQSASLMLLAALLLAIPAFPLCGWLSDRIGRKRVMLSGFVLAGLTYFALFGMLGTATNPALFDRAGRGDVVLHAPVSACSTQVNLIAPAKATSFCDAARTTLAARGIPYSIVPTPVGAQGVTIGGRTGIAADRSGDIAGDTARLQDALTRAGFAKAADPARIDWLAGVAIIWIMVAYVALAYAPLAAALAEMFPTEIRYTSLSLSYNLSVGWIGGLLPSIAYALVLATGDTFFGLWYPVSITLVAALALLFLVEDRTGCDIANDPQAGRLSSR